MNSEERFWNDRMPTSSFLYARIRAIMSSFSDFIRVMFSRRVLAHPAAEVHRLCTFRDELRGAPGSSSISNWIGTVPARHGGAAYL